MKKEQKVPVTLDVLFSETAESGHICGSDRSEVIKINREDKEEITKSISRDNHISFFEAEVMVREVYFGLVF